jgi:hypothetical protein
VEFRADFGTCFVRSAALVLDLPGATLVFGVVKAATPEEIAAFGEGSLEPFIHAWVEYKGEVFAPTLLERLGAVRGFSTKDYYEANGVKRTWRLDHPGFQAIAKRYKLAAAFKHGSDRPGKGEVTEAFLRAAGVKFRISEERAVLPA